MGKRKKLNVLVLCTGNSARSQMAEGFLRKYGSDRFNAYSAGTAPKGVNPLTVEVMSESGVDISAHTSKHLNEYLGHIAAHYLIIVCTDADESCPAIWPGMLQRLVWPLEDPAAATGSREDKLKIFRRVRDTVESKVKEWLATTDGPLKRSK